MCSHTLQRKEEPPVISDFAWAQQHLLGEGDRWGLTVKVLEAPADPSCSYYQNVPGDIAVGRRVCDESVSSCLIPFAKALETKLALNVCGVFYIFVF